MSSKDFAVSVTGAPIVGQVSRKPRYLLKLEDLNGKNKVMRNFIAIDKPDLLNNFIQVKGIYSDLEENDILESFNDILDNSAKENIVDMMFPSHRVYSIRSLVFNAHKPTTLLR